MPHKRKLTDEENRNRWRSFSEAKKGVKKNVCFT